MNIKQKVESAAVDITSKQSAAAKTYGVDVSEFEISKQRYMYRELIIAYNNGVRNGADIRKIADKYNVKDENIHLFEDKTDNTLTLHYEFKPCPFCGGKAALEVPDCGMRVFCTECGIDMYMPIKEEGNEMFWVQLLKQLPDLSDRWNKRV